MAGPIRDLGDPGRVRGPALSSSYAKPCAHDGVPASATTGSRGARFAGDDVGVAFARLGRMLPSGLSARPFHWSSPRVSGYIVSGDSRHFLRDRESARAIAARSDLHALHGRHRSHWGVYFIGFSTAPPGEVFDVVGDEIVRSEAFGASAWDVRCRIRQGSAEVEYEGSVFGLGLLGALAGWFMGRGVELRRP